MFWAKTPLYLAAKVSFRVACNAINDELKIYDDAFKNYLWVKVFDDDVFAIIKSHCIFYLSLCFKMVSFMGSKKLGPRPNWSPLGV